MAPSPLAIAVASVAHPADQRHAAAADHERHPYEGDEARRRQLDTGAARAAQQRAAAPRILQGESVRRVRGAGCWRGVSRPKRGVAKAWCGQSVVWPKR
eukprot:3477327-Prymnesium_polylepis.1